MRRKTGDESYRHYISEMAHRYQFDFYKEDGPAVDVIWKVDGCEKIPIVTSEEYPANSLWFYAWKKLREEYGEEFAFGKPKNWRKRNE